ncbi:MAG: gamma-glutamyltransferase [Gammaproteobacteria bacterium]|nr:gamma-glutamyltransferase [Gammaproteobacteria bacterium]
MLHTAYAPRGMAVAPHGRAAESGAAVLHEGGDAVEACVAMAAGLAVLYPHMSGIGGDGFWLVHEPGREPWGVDACGAAAAGASIEGFRGAGLAAVPVRGPWAASTVAGTVAGWRAALATRAGPGGRGLPLARLLEDAIRFAREGYPVSPSQSQAAAAHRRELAAQPGFAGTFLVESRAPAAGARLAQPALADTLERLARSGLQDFYTGELGAAIAADLREMGSPLGAEDLAAHRAEIVAPLALALRGGTLYNLPPPTQGVASLLILGLFERLAGGALTCDGAEHVHLLVEATKVVFGLRDRYLRDPRDMGATRVSDWLGEPWLGRLASAIDPAAAAPWQGSGEGGDTTWLGAIDRYGRAASCIQSLYHAFGSGVVLPTTGILWHNRSHAFGLDPAAARALRPGRKPPHTLNPALARLADGATMVYGAMGGDGQPQTQAAIYTRHVVFGRPLQEALTAPRWLLGRNWGAPSSGLKLESRFAPEVVEGLRARGQPVEVVAAFDPVMGHAGALVRRADGLIEGAADPRSDGAAVGW